MFLKSLDIYGFKSFADKTHIDFAGGITSLLGPNGCGKSNIVDSIKWVLGETSTRSLRAGKMEDVIFNGTDTRKPMPFAEVELTIDNSEHQLPTEVPEISIKRRYFRTGESEYFLNGQKCLKRNIMELFFDTGVGKSAYSILEQGKIDQILSSKPEDRRYLFEEAAGISKYKDQCHKAELDLEKTNLNIEDITRSYNEAKRACDRSRSQAEKAKKARELQQRAFDIDVKYHLARIRSYTLLREERQRRKAKAGEEIERLKALMANLEESIGDAQEKTRAENEELYALQLALGRVEKDISMCDERINLYTENFQSASLRLKNSDEKIANIQSSIDRARADLENAEDSISEKEERAEEEERQIAAIVMAQESKKLEIEKLEKDADARERRNSELDGELMSLTEELKAVIEDLIAEVDANTDTAYTSERREKAETAFRNRAEELLGMIGNRVSFLSSLEDEALISREIAMKDFGKVSEGISELISLFGDYIASIPPIVDSLLSQEGLISRKRDIEKREAAARKEAEENRKAILSARESVRMLRSDVDSYSAALEQQREHCRRLLSDLESAKFAAESLRRSIEEKENDKEREIEASDKDRSDVDNFLSIIKGEEEKKGALRAELDIKSGELASRREESHAALAALQKMREDKDKAFSDYNEATRIYSEQDGYLSTTDEYIQNISTDFFNKYTRNLGEFQKVMEEEELPDDTLLLNELNEVNKELEGLGTINYMAEDDYNAAKEQFDFYSRHLDDLNKARTDLERVLQEIEDKAKDLFMATYDDISRNFQSMFNRLFGGGIAKLTLEDPENVLTSGIDIFAQPPGKKLVRLSLLSGGERTMTAVALLFATFEVKPSPFCILDELDAALDDKNIGYFLSVLDDFGQKSQFIIITHNKHTVTGSETLLGVTQMEPGVSTTVSYRLARVEGQPVIMNDDDSVVDFDADGKQKR